MKPQRSLLLACAVALLSNAACVAQDWQPAIVRDVSDSGKKVDVRTDHGELRYYTSSDITQTFAIQTVDHVYYAQRMESGRFSHACETPVKAHVEVRLTDNGTKLTLEDGSDKFHFSVKKVMTLQQYAAVPYSQRHSAMEESVGMGTNQPATDDSMKSATLE